MSYKKIILQSVFYMVFAIMLTGCVEIENTILSESVSPNNKYAAVIFSRDAGATTTTSYNLSIIKNGKELASGVGNAFHSDSTFSVEWVGDKKLVVEIHNESKRIIIQNEKVKEIMIEYIYAD